MDDLWAIIIRTVTISILATALAAWALRHRSRKGANGRRDREG